MSTELNVEMTVNTDSERTIFAYGGSMAGEMFVLAVFRCPSCGSTGKADSWCEGHSAPAECMGQALRCKREPVLVPHAEPERATTDTYDISEQAEALDESQRDRKAAEDAQAKAEGLQPPARAGDDA